MGGAIFIDTGFIIAFFNEDDKNHLHAQNTIKMTLTKDSLIKFYFSDYIFDELITLLKIRKVSNESIQEIGDKILNSKIWKLIKITERDFEQAWKMIKKYQDKEWSFTDTSSFILIENYKIPFYLSYDKHFSEYPNIKKWIVD